MSRKEYLELVEIANMRPKNNEDRQRVKDAKRLLDEYYLKNNKK